MSLCDLCRNTTGICNLEESWKTRSFQIVIENGLEIEQNNRLIPEVEDRKLQSQITRLQKELESTARTRGCGKI